MNISKKTIDTLTKVGCQVIYYDDCLNDTIPSKANKLGVGFFDGKYIGMILKAPSKKEVTLSWIFNKINKDNSYTNLTNYINKLIAYNDYSIYSASYGIGVWAFGDAINKAKNQIEPILKRKGIDYHFEMSDAGWVFRIVISKSKHNMDILAELKK